MPRVPESHWTDKPNAVITAEVATDPAVMDEILQFVHDNPLPRWKFHEGIPWPARAKGEQSMQWYWDRGHPYIINRDQDGMLWGARILSRNGKHILWAHFRRTPDYTHDALRDNPVGGLAPQHKAVMLHSRALQWAISGEVEEKPPPVENDAAIELFEDRWDQIWQETFDLYRNVYAPMYGREV